MRGRSDGLGIHRHDPTSRSASCGSLRSKRPRECFRVDGGDAGPLSSSAQGKLRSYERHLKKEGCTMLGRRQIHALNEQRPVLRAGALFLAALAVAMSAAQIAAAGPAAESPAPAAAPSEDVGPLQEIVVTATRHEEGLSQGADQRHGPDPGRDGCARHQGYPGCGALHPRNQHRQFGHQQHRDPRHRLDRRRRHHRHLSRRHAHSNARARLQSRRGAAAIVRSRPRRGAARAAGHAVRRGLRGRHGPLHHDAAELDPDQHLQPRRSLVHRRRRAELRGGHRGRHAGHRRHVRRARDRLVSL